MTRPLPTPERALPAPDRRTLLRAAGAWALGAGLGTGLGACAVSPPPLPVQPAPARLDPLIEDIAARTFRFFWERANPKNGLMPDRWPARSAASIAATGFALTALPIGVGQGAITRAQARERALVTLRFLARAPLGADPRQCAGFQGFFYHYLDMDSGLRAGYSELSTVDTALLMAGVLHCQAWFDDPVDPQEAEIRELADLIYARVDWTWAQVHMPLVTMAWSPENGFGEADWRGYDEGMLVYILALGSATHPVRQEAWTAWTANYAKDWGAFEGPPYLAFGPLFGHQYSHLWIDFRGIADPFMALRGIDYFENSRRATYAQRAYAALNPLHWKGYDSLCWGFTACDGPAYTTQTYQGEARIFAAYAARGVGRSNSFDDGTIAPTATLGSIAFAPEIVVPAAHALVERHGERIYGSYGFLDAFNPSFTWPVALEYGRVDPVHGWVDSDYLGIDQGLILGMISNARDQGVWQTMRRHPAIARGLRRAGFAGGWLSGAR